MGNFNKGGDRGGFSGRSGNRGSANFRSSGRDRKFSGGGFRDRQKIVMHKVVCDECGSKCEVPFKPSSDKPIFCDNCFAGKRENKRDSYTHKGGERRNYSNDSESKDIKNLLLELNTKLDLLISLSKESEEIGEEIENKKTTKVEKTKTKKASPKKK